MNSEEPKGPTGILTVRAPHDVCRAARLAATQRGLTVSAFMVQLLKERLEAPITAEPHD